MPADGPSHEDEGTHDARSHPGGGSSIDRRGILHHIRAAHGLTPREDVDLEQTGEIGQAAAPGIDPEATRASRYDLGPEIARGGMGAILEVRDPDLRRSLAMKVLLGVSGNERKPGGEVHPEHLSRFLEEAQITAQLAHPGVIPVHELGMDDEGRIYFTMNLVRGKTLSQIFELARASKDGWTRPRALQAILRVCETLAFAHDKGVVHRDIKPENVMVGRFGETYVMDWGLAKVLGKKGSGDEQPPEADPAMLSIVESDRAGGAGVESPIMTMDGAVIGTPAYMSPEQASGALDQVTRRSDVYSIGALLYELIAGHPPYVEDGAKPSPVQVLLAARAGPPKPLREIASDVPEELVAICEKAMSRDRDARYHTAADLAEDIQAFIEGRVVKAYRTGTLIELRKWVGRNSGTAAAMAAAVLALVAGLVASLALTAEAKRREVETARKAYAASLAAATAEISRHNLPAAAGRLDGLPEKLRGWEWHHLRSRLQESLHETEAVQFARLPDGRVMIAARDGSIRRLDLRSGKTEPFHPPGAGHWHDSATTQWTRGTLLLRDLGPTKEFVAADTGKTLCTVEVPPEGDFLFAGAADGSRYSWKFDDEVASVLDGRTGRIEDWQTGTGAPGAFSDDGELVSMHAGRRTEIVDFASRTVLCSIDVQAYASCFSPDKTRVAVADGRVVRLYDTASGAPAGCGSAAGHTDVIVALAFSPDGSLLATGSRDRTLRLIDTESGETLEVLAGHSAGILQLDFSNDGRWLISRDSVGDLRVWDVGARRDPHVLRGHASYVYPVAFTPDGQRIVSGGWDGWAGKPGCIRVWDAATGEPVAAWGTKDRIVESLAIAPDGSRIFTCGRGEEDAYHSNRLQVWDAATGRPLPAPEGDLCSVEVSADGRLLAAGEGTALRLFDARTLADLGSLEHSLPVAAPAFRPDGAHVATVSITGTLRVWDTRSGELLLELPAHESGQPGRTLSYSPDGRRLYVASWDDHAVRVRDAKTGALLDSLEGHGDAVFDVLPETRAGRTFSAGKEGRILVWDTETQEQITALTGHESYVYRLALSPDGETLVSSSGDGTLRIWETRPDRDRQQAIADRRDLVAELEPRVRKLFDELESDDDVVARLRMASDLDERRREVALQVALGIAVERRTK